MKPGARPPGHCVFFLKPTPELLSIENFDDIVAIGESTGESLPCISSILDKHSVGFTDLPTLLPLPAVDFPLLEQKLAEEEEEGLVSLDRAMLVQLESTVSTWLYIVDVSLSRPSKAAAEKNGNPLSTAVAAALSWEARAAALENLDKQLQYPSITVATQALLKAGSSVAPSFLQSCYNVAAAAEEARSIAIALCPLVPLFERLYTSEDVSNASDTVTLCMHGIFLTWQHCDALRSGSSNALSLLLQAMANDVVEVAQRCVYGRELLQGDLNQASETARGILRMLGHMKSCYVDAKDKAASDTFPTAASTFRAIDALMSRCQDIHTVCTTSAQYAILEKIDLGGPEGGTFTLTARHLYSQFASIQEKVISQGSGTVDPFDLTDSAFCNAISTWKYGVQQLDARLAVFITRVLEAAPTFDGCCKIVESFESLCDRSVVRRCIEAIQLKAVKAFVHDVRAVEEVFECEKAAPPVAIGTPPCAQAVTWVRGLQERLTVPMAWLRTVNQSILQSEPGREMMRVYDSVLRMLRSHEDRVMAAWCETSAGISDATMEQPVLRVAQTLVSSPNNANPLHLTPVSMVHVNFDPALSLLLKEVRALTAMSGLVRPIPTTALAFFQQEAVLLQHISALKQIVAELNTIKSSLLAVEAPLVASALTAAENIVAKGQREVTWASKELDTFCNNARQCRMELAKQVKLLRDIVSATEADIQQWQKDFPISYSATDAANNINSFASLKRAVVSSSSPLSLQSFADLSTWFDGAAAHRKRAVDEGLQRLQARLETAAEELGLVPTLPSWVEYSQYMSTTATNGCVDAVVVSLGALKGLLVAEPGETGFSLPPLLTVALHVESTGGLQWSPQLGSWKHVEVCVPGKGLPNTVAEIFEKYSFALHSLCSSFSLDRQQSEETPALQDGLAAVRTAFATCVSRCEYAASQLSSFQHEVEIASTCTAATALLNSSDDGILEKQLLEEIEAEILRLRTVQESIHQIPSVQTPLGWISMDFEPAKQALATAAGKHVALLTERIKHLLEKKLTSTMDFINNATDTMQSASSLVHVKERRPTVAGASSAASRRASTVVSPVAGQRSSLMGRASVLGSSSKLSSKASVVGGSSTDRRSSAATAGPTTTTVSTVNSQQLYSLNPKP